MDNHNFKNYNFVVMQMSLAEISCLFQQNMFVKQAIPFIQQEK